jgi:hypothetical protein
VSGEPRQLPTQAGPVPDRISIWPLDDGRYGLDATFQGATGYERADRHIAHMRETDVEHSLRQELGDSWTIRFSPLTATEISKALTAFVT